LLKIVILFDLYKFNLGELIKQFYKRKDLKRLYKKQFNTLLPGSIIKEKFYKDNIKKE
jgi:hypothetical protein